MTLKISDGVANAMLDAIETYAGTGVKFEVWAGSVPADESASTSGCTMLVEITAPSDWAGAASAGVKSKSGTWTNAAVATGTAAFFRLCSSAGTPFLQGSVTATGGGGDATIDNTSIAATQTVTVTSLSITAPHL